MLKYILAAFYLLHQMWRKTLPKTHRLMNTHLSVSPMIIIELIIGTTRQAEIAAAKQALRDVTADTRIEAATTPEELILLTLDTLLV